ncbi:NADH:flavin oxidoreductase/NADH oxidase [Roseovarius indicus]|uniref:NADPH dehydrogenase n=2 Tax=Roseovarius indicus TaxID=540747 RepID=A0A5P3A9X7_9RHOB|nr:NADH:flavin oxidoreductase/NADH oxidase [Roseovarius indicus]QEW25380.1 NADPH dehydrogenase [Roseovarius indicus]SFE06031.1 2,4-dienoyl-CoA reductase [Roseovarius indicus]
MPDTMLFEPLQLRGVTLPNRIAVSPMQVYMADAKGMANDWHLHHLGKFATGGAGLVFTEGLIVDPVGRSTYSDCGIWTDAQIPPLRRITDFLRAQGAVPAAQLHHAGAKAARRRAWEGFSALDDEDAAKGEPPWQPVGVSEARTLAKYHAPRAMTDEEVAAIPETFAQAARRADTAGFDVVELHGAHGYLIHSFLSPVSNTRGAPYGGSPEARMKLALDVAEAVREVWPARKPLFVRLSCVDGVEGGLCIEDSVRLAHELKARGVDVIDCSSGGIRSATSSSSSGPPKPGFQVPYADQIRREADLATMAVGLILKAQQAEDILRNGDADIIALGRAVLEDPNWGLRAAHELGLDPNRDRWPNPYAWAVRALDAARDAG